MRDGFWKNLSVNEWTNEEWEGLCDGCGKCCLIRLEDEDTGDIYNTDVHCKLLDGANCRCTNYENRRDYVEDCVQLTRENIYELSWLPKTCAYRLVAENKPLFDWHYLISGDKDTVHNTNMSIAHMTTSEIHVKVRNLPRRIKIWPGEG